MRVPGACAASSAACSAKVRLLTYYQNPGYLRVQFLPNGDYLLIGARDFKDVDHTRYYDQEFWIMKGDARTMPIPLGQKVSEGVAISRTAMKIAWANDFRTSPDLLAEGECAIFVGDIVYDGDKPRIANKKEAVRSRGRVAAWRRRTFATTTRNWSTSSIATRRPCAWRTCSGSI